MTPAKYLRSFTLTTIFALSTCSFCAAATASFSWLPNSSSDGTVGYKIHYGTSSGKYTKTVNVGSPSAVGGRIYADVTQLTADQTYYFTVAAYNASGVESSYSKEIACSAGSSAVVSYALLINAGGGEYKDKDGNVWAADYGYNTGVKANKSVAISSTADDALFQTQRYDSASGSELKYTFNVPNGSYTANLYFAENYTGAFHQNGRVFDILIEGKTVEYRFDIYSEAGKNNAIVKSYQVNVTDGKLNIEFQHEIENPTIAAIEILSN